MKNIAFLMSLFTFKIMSFAQSNFRDDFVYDEEQEHDMSRMEGFHFTTTETWMIPIGLVLFYFGFNLYKKRQSEKQKEGSLPIVLMVIGFLCVTPLLIGILGIVNNLIALVIIIVIIAIAIKFILSMFK
jgi:ABC-type antimicrobial peptide transport system permease subunit